MIHEQAAAEDKGGKTADDIQDGPQEIHRLGGLCSWISSGRFFRAVFLIVPERRNHVPDEACQEKGAFHPAETVFSDTEEAVLKTAENEDHGNTDIDRNVPA